MAQVTKEELQSLLTKEQFDTLEELTDKWCMASRNRNDNDYAYYARQISIFWKTIAVDQLRKNNVPKEG